MTEKEVIDEFFVLIGKIAMLSINRPNNSAFWDEISKDVQKVLEKITKDKMIYGW